MQEKDYEFTLQCRVKRGYSGLLVGQCIEIPEIIVQGESLDEIQREIFDGIKGFLKAFPEEINNFTKKEYAVLVGNEGQGEKITDKKQQEEKLPESQQELVGEWQEIKPIKQIITIGLRNNTLCS